jgi:hypothetical protein
VSFNLSEWLTLNHNAEEEVLEGDEAEEAREEAVVREEEAVEAEEEEVDVEDLEERRTRMMHLLGFQ